MKEIKYEWKIEEIDEYGDPVGDSIFFGYGELPHLGRNLGKEKEDGYIVVSLVKYVFENHGDWEELLYRTRAYFEDNELNDEFDNGDKVPKKFLNEFQKLKEKNK